MPGIIVIERVNGRRPECCPVMFSQVLDDCLVPLWKSDTIDHRENIAVLWDMLPVGIRNDVDAAFVVKQMFIHRLANTF